MPISSKTEIISEIKEVAELMSSMNMEELALNPKLGVLNFSFILVELKNCQTYIQKICSVDLNLFTMDQLEKISKEIHLTQLAINRIAKFNIQKAEAMATRNDLVRIFLNTFEAFQNETLPLILYGMALNKTDQHTNNSKKIYKDLANSLAVDLKNLEEKTKEIDSLIAVTKDALSKQGVSKESSHFHEESLSHKKSSEHWLEAIILCSLLICTWGGLILFSDIFQIPENANATLLTQLFLGKIIVLSGFYYILLWCIKNYNASKHNFVVNKHRENALKTFQTFVEATTSEDIRQAILIQATSCIFSPQPSGYQKADNDGDGANKIIEITRNINSINKPPA